MKKTLLCMILFCCVILISACGMGDRASENGAETAQGMAADTAGTLTTVRQDLSVSTPIRNEAQMIETGEILRNALAFEGIDLHVNISSYLMEERDEHFTRMLSLFAAGDGFDVIVNDNMPLLQFVENGFLADLNNLINLSPSINRGDFFENVLDSLEIGGGLYHMPVQFGFDFIGINSNVPWAFAERFSALDRASPSDIMGIYRDLIYEHPEFADLAFIYNTSPFFAFAPEINRLLDIPNRAVNFTDAQTLSFLESINEAFHLNTRFYTPLIVRATVEEMELLQSRYVFARFSGIGNIDALFTYEPPFFVYPVPLADESGNLLNWDWSGTRLSVGHDANPFALDFVMQAIETIANESFRYSLEVPISRHLFTDTVERGLRTVLEFAPRREVFGSAFDQLRLAHERLYEYSNLPIISPFATNSVPFYPIADTFSGIMNSTLSAEDGAAQMEQEIIAWMDMEREIEELPEEPTIEPRDHLPERTITVLTPSIHTNVIQAAADAINDLWAVEGREYNFNVELDTFDITDWEGSEGRLTRLQTQLMAGQGPDMFIWDRQPMHAFARSGLFADIYALIDDCEYSRREDFFTNVLAAFELSGGLYKFPFSFGVQYVGISAIMPPSVIDRFSAYSAISITQMMDIYLYLIDNYTDEFSHMSFATNWNLGLFTHVFNAVAGGFIDFNERTANLTDDRFISFLGNLERIFSMDANAPGWMRGESPITSARFLREQAAERVFIVEKFSLNPVNAFFTPEQPHVLNYIPIVDDYGRILIDFERRGPDGWQTWALACIPAAGDSALAWELVRNMVPIYSHPTGRAALDPGTGTPAFWGNMSLSSPIQRSLFESQTRRAFQHAFNTGFMQPFVGVQDLDNRARQIDAAVSRMAGYNQMPMTVVTHGIPSGVLSGLWGLFDRLITPEAAAQQLQNSFSLWLIE